MTSPTPPSKILIRSWISAGSLLWEMVFVTLALLGSLTMTPSGQPCCPLNSVPNLLPCSPFSAMLPCQWKSTIYTGWWFAFGVYHVVVMLWLQRGFWLVKVIANVEFIRALICIEASCSPSHCLLSYPCHPYSCPCMYLLFHSLSI